MKDPGRGPVSLSTARPVFRVGVERGGWGIVLGGLAHCWALRDQPSGWLLVASFGCVCTVVWVVVVGGFVV